MLHDAVLTGLGFVGLILGTLAIWQVRTLGLREEIKRLRQQLADRDRIGEQANDELRRETRALEARVAELTGEIDRMRREAADVQVMGPPAHRSQAPEGGQKST